MMNEKKSYKVQIFKEYYVLSSDEPEDLVIKAAELVDAFMKEISYQCVNVTDLKKIAVLSALRIANQLLHCEREHRANEQKIVALKNYIDEELSLLSL